MYLFTSVQLLSCVQLFETPWTAECQVSLSITNSWSLLKLMYIESVMPSNHLILCPHLLPSIFPSNRVFSNELVLHIRCQKDWSFSFSISLSNKYSGLISFRKSPYPNVNPVMTHRRHKTKTYKAFCQIIKTHCRAFQA